MGLLLAVTGFRDGTRAAMAALQSTVYSAIASVPSPLVLSVIWYEGNTRPVFFSCGDDGLVRRLSLECVD